jgi:hypothetical protein
MCFFSVVRNAADLWRLHAPAQRRIWKVQTPTGSILAVTVDGQETSSASPRLGIG